MISIEIDNPEKPDVTALVERHLRFSHENSPENSCFAFDVSALKGPDVTFWTAREDGRAIGTIALKEIEPGHGEIKSVHTHSDARGKGVGRKLVETVIEVAQARGWHRLSLESGTNEAFKPSRLLYEATGFEQCPAFGDYEDGTFSYCMTREI